MSGSDRRFPIMRWGSIPWGVIAPHEERAKSNHGGQSLEKLASRGGLDPVEAIAVLEGRPWLLGMNKKETRDARGRCIEVLIRQHGGEHSHD